MIERRLHKGFYFQKIARGHWVVFLTRAAEHCKSLKEVKDKINETLKKEGNE